MLFKYHTPYPETGKIPKRTTRTSNPSRITTHNSVLENRKFLSGGSKVEQLSSSEAFGKCGREDAQGALYNAMIHPYTVGPMALTGFTWYQGEANAKGGDSGDLYSCLFPATIKSWRKDFKLSSPNDLYFGFIQLSTWCLPGRAIPELRNAQMSAHEKLQNIGYATNADHGSGCNIHPRRTNHVLNASHVRLLLFSTVKMTLYGVRHHIRQHRQLFVHLAMVKR